MDRVSNLPDELLCNVLSFLTTKEAALTSIISQRWRNLFALVPELDLDDSVFLHPEEGKGERDDIRESFRDFVDRILALQGDAPIDKVSLKCQTGDDSDYLDAWITNVLARGVSDLVLYIVSNDRYLLSPEGFESSKLVKLELGQGIDLGWWADGIYLPVLKTLILDSVEFCVNKFQMLLPACPVLEELDMANIEGLGPDVTVSSASLKTLRIRCSIGSNTFSFDTPSLVTLGYYDHVPEDCPLANLINLFEARINLIVTEAQMKEAREAEYDDVNIYALIIGCVTKFMTAIHNVHTLYLTHSTLEVLSLCCESMPVFNNLTFLGFHSGTSRWEAVPVLIKSCPHLQTLSISGLLHHVTDSCGDVCDCIPREDKGSSLESCQVEKIQIQGFIGAMREFMMIGHFMDYFPCLEEIEICVEGHGPTELDDPAVTDLKEQMLKLYEKSDSCNVEVKVCESLFRKLLAQ